MFFGRKEKAQQCDFPILKTDLHSHILPGIDDGSKSIEESLAMLQAMSDLGYQKVITTPHVMADLYRNSSVTIRDKLAILQEAAKNADIPIEIEAGAEYYLDEELIHRLRSDDLLTISDRYVLFETSYSAKPINFEEAIFEMGAKGYKPILAHPERYRYITDPHGMYDRIKELGVFFQIDINSLGGHYGKQAKDLAWYLCEHGMVDFLGSDAHGMRHISFLDEVFKLPYPEGFWSRNEIKNNFL